MIKVNLFLIIFFLYSSNIFATNVAVIDVNFLINNSNHFIDISNKINNSQIEYKEKFKTTEENLYQ